MRKLIVPVVLAAMVALVACGKKEPAAVTPPPEPVPVVAQTPVTPPPAPEPLAIAKVALGNAIDADKKVTSELVTFGVKDTIYLSVESKGAGHAKLRALWSYLKGDKTAKVNETSMEFDATGPAWNEFHVENAKGWPKGDYRVEIFLGDSPTPAATTGFKVQ